MSQRTVVSAVAVAFVLGTATGVTVADTPLFARAGASFSKSGKISKHQPSNLRGLLAQLFETQTTFVLTGVDDPTGRCNIAVSVTGLHDDYMAVSADKRGEWFVPYAAIYSVHREGPGPITVPVLSTTAFPVPKFCGD